MLELRDFRIIRAIHQERSLARAARLLGIGQPALTRGLAGIEAKLNGRLFERNRRGVVATDLCRAVLPEADEILDRVDRLDRHLKAVRGPRTRVLSIVAGAYAAETIGVSAAGRMLADFPTAQIRLAVANWAEVPRAVLERDASIGLLDISELRDSPDLEIEALRPLAGIFVARAGHPLASASELRLADILAWPFVFIGRTPRRIQEPFIAAREEARAAGRDHAAFPALVHESPTVALTAVRESDAVAAVTVPIAAPLLEAGALVALRWRAPWLIVNVGIIRPRRHDADEIEEAFLDRLRAAHREAEAQASRFLSNAGIPTPIS